nr:MAG TPA: hypothetical protein [Caudoviricetes sp.]
MAAPSWTLLKISRGISFRINGAPIGLYQMSGDRYWTR